MQNLFVGNLNWATTSEDLAEAFGEFGEVVSAVHVEDRYEPGRKRGFGFVEMASAEAARAAVDGLMGREMDGREIRVDWSDSGPGGKRASTSERDGGGGGQRRTGYREGGNTARYGEGPATNGRRIYVGNLSFQTEDDTIAQVFSEVRRSIDEMRALRSTLRRPRCSNAGAPGGSGAASRSSGVRSGATDSAAPSETDRSRDVFLPRTIPRSVVLVLTRATLTSHLFSVSSDRVRGAWVRAAPPPSLCFALALSLVAQFGTVEAALHLSDRNNPDYKRGFGFVTMSTIDEANAAVSALDGAEIDGRPVRINIAKDR